MTWLRLLHLVIGLKDSRHFFSQWEAKPKPKPSAPCTRDFSCALSKFHIIARNCDADILAIPIANTYNFRKFFLEPIIRNLSLVSYSYLLRFCFLSRAVRFVAFLMRNVLSKRTKATILFATETGRSERFAWNLAKVLLHIFDVKVRVFTFVRINVKLCVPAVAYRSLKKPDSIIVGYAMLMRPNKA